MEKLKARIKRDMKELHESLVRKAVCRRRGQPKLSMKMEGPFEGKSISFDNCVKYVNQFWKIRISSSSCRPVVRALVYQPNGPGSIPGMSRSESAITRGNPIMLLPSTPFSWTTCSCANLPAGFLARDCYEGIQTWELWSVFWSEATEGQFIASLLVAQWLGCWCTSLVRSLCIIFQIFPIPTKAPLHW